MPRKDPESRREYAREYARSHADEARKRAREYYETHKDDPEFKRKLQERSLAWKRENPERVLEARRVRRRERMATDPSFVEATRAAKRRAAAKKIPAIKGLVAERKSAGCLCCPETELACLDFHHLNPAEKSFQITPYQLVHKSLESISAEIDKCVVLCANCHRKFHAGVITLQVAALSHQI